ncbi:hypothetical protein ABFS82_14G192400 [Erythranthe guttata]
MVGMIDPHLNIFPTSSIAKTNGNSEMDVPVKRRIRPYYFRRCKEKRKSFTSIESLPCELLFDILVHLPAEDIYNGAMLVCRNWYNMIRTHDFIHAHLQHSTPGIVLHNSHNKMTRFMTMREGRIELSKYSYTISAYDGWDSCNGLILEYYLYGGPRRFHIINLATKQIFEIPHFPRQETIDHWWSIAYSAASNQYKVVRTYKLNKVDKLSYCDIVTVGVDKSWRRVCIQHLSPESRLLLRRESVTTEGFVHYMHRFDNNHVLTLNVETETITEYAIPKDLGEKSRRCLSTGKSLFAFAKCKGEIYCEVWEMKSETGEWTKMYEIDLFAHKSKLEELYGGKGIGSERFVPMGWLKYHEVVIFRFTYPARFHIAYNVRTHEIDWFELASDDMHEFKFHTNSLVGLVSL